MDPSLIVGLLGIAATFAGTVIGFVLGLSAAKPRLIWVGSGSSGASVPLHDLMIGEVSIQNSPRYLGMRVHRETARLTEARIYDPELKELVGPALVWDGMKPNSLTTEINIESGRSARLLLFAKYRYSKECFVYTASRLDEEPQQANGIYDEKKKDFSIVLHDTNDRWYIFDMTLRNTDQSPHIQKRRGSRKERVKLRKNVL